MTQEDVTAQAEESSAEAAVGVEVGPSPHLARRSFATQWMMADVLVGLAPAIAMSVLVFRWYAVLQVALCVLTCLVGEAVFTWMRGRPVQLWDLSAVVTGVILALSLPWSTVWYVSVIGSLAAVGLGKAAFGGLGGNIFNPAMVGRAFVMLSFAKALGASAYVSAQAELAVVTQATPLTVAKKVAADVAAGKIAAGAEAAHLGSAGELWPLFLGTVNGSLGETSAFAMLLGGIYLCWRRSAAWQVPVSVIASAFVLAAAANAIGLTPFTGLQHLLSGSLLMGAFFIATDPVTSPITPRGRWIFGIGVGVLVMLIRLFSGYPEGVMFAVLLMNAAVPLLNRWTIPVPLGGRAARAG